MAHALPLPPLNALRAFDAAGRHLNFRLAAEELGVTQGAVAQHVRGLEASLGLALFERRPRRLVFTEAGRRYHAQISRAFAELASATAELRPTGARATISVTPTFASKWLIPALPRFTAAHPGIDLRVLATESRSSFHSDGIDLAVRQGQPPFGAALDATLLFRQEIIAVCTPGLFAASEEAAGQAPFARMALLHDTHNLWPRFLKECLGVEADTERRGLRFNQTTLSIDAALAGQGVALASRFLVARDLAARRLMQPVPDVFRGGQDFYLLSPRQPRPSPAAAAVRNWLISERDGQEAGENAN